MFKKRAQGLSITVIIAAVIGLIVLVVVIMMLTGKLGAFGKGVESASSCENTCKAIGRDEIYTRITESGCKSTNGATYMPGIYSDIKGGTATSPYVCCCRSPN